MTKKVKMPKVRRPITPKRSPKRRIRSSQKNPDQAYDLSRSSAAHSYRVSSAPGGIKPAELLTLQATMGNAAVQRMVKGQGRRCQRGAGLANIGSVLSTFGNNDRQTQPGGSVGIIQRAPTGVALIIEKTHLRKPNKQGTAPKKGPALFTYLGKAVEKETKIELLGTKVSDPKNNVLWQKARHPSSGKIGFVRMSKVLAPSMGKATDVKGPDKPGTVDQVGKLAAFIKKIIGDGSKIGVSIGGMLTAKKKSEKDLAAVLLNKPEFREKWFQFGTKPTKDQAESLMENDLPLFKDVLGEGGQLGFKIGELSTGVLGDVVGAFGGLIGMIQGYKKFKGDKATLSTKIEAAVKSFGGLSAIAKSATGALGKVTGFVGGFLEGDVAKEIAGTAKQFLGFIGSGIDTVKGTVQTVFKVGKAIGNAFKQKGKSAKAKITAFIDAAGDIASSALGTIKAGVQTVAGFLKTIKSVPIVSSILGIVGSVIDLVTGALDLIKTIYSAIKLVIKIKAEKALVEELESDGYKKTEAALPQKLERMEKAVKPSNSKPTLTVDKKGKPTVQQQEKTLAKYLAFSGRKSTQGKQDAQDVQTHLMEEKLVDVVYKRIKRAYSRIPELLADGTAAAISIIGGLVSIAADIAAVATAPTGIGTAAAVATKTIASTVTSVLSSSVKASKSVYKLIRVGARKVKQFARDKGWYGANKENSTEKKQARNVEATKALMLSVADLDPESPDFEAQAKRAQLRLKATGVDLTELFAKNGQPDDQAKLVMKALNQR